MGGASVRYGDPWAVPSGARDPLRRLRGRLVLPVTVWTAASAQDQAVDRAGGAGEPQGASCPRGAPGARGGAGEVREVGDELVGLTVSSVLFAQGEPAMLAGLVSPAAELATLLEGPGARFAVHVLSKEHRRLAQHFAGELPAGPELLALEESTHGPLLSLAKDRVLCTTSAARPFGWSLLIEAVVDEVQLAAPGRPLAWYRGEFRGLA
jgi:3-hydroxy-9,10-secoandrosta-1,3,5(10)-triene-9,17-dione monooxygenase reductase component